MNNENNFKNLDFKLKKFFNEISNFYDVPDRPISIFLGGKNRGKSYYCFFGENMFFDHIKRGHKVFYIRNSQQECLNMKAFFLQELQKIFPDADITSNDQGIYFRKSKEQIIRFVSSKNYNSVSGNVEAYSFGFFDEFNQTVNKSTIRLMYDLPLIINTLFRTNSVKMVFCGNTCDQNNPIYDIFEIPELNKNQTFTNNNFFLLRFADDLFTESSTKNESLFKSAKNYDDLFLGNSYKNKNNLILRNLIVDEQFEKEDYSFMLNDLIYNLYRIDDYLFVVRSSEAKGVLFIDEFAQIVQNQAKSFYKSSQMTWIFKKFLRNEIFFSDSNSYFSFLQGAENAREYELLEVFK